MRFLVQKRSLQPLARQSDNFQVLFAMKWKLFCAPPFPLISTWHESVGSFAPSSVTCWSFWSALILDPGAVASALTPLWTKSHLGDRLLEERRVLGYRCANDSRWRRWSWRRRKLKRWWGKDRRRQKQRWWRSRWRAACFLLARLSCPEADLPQHPKEGLLFCLFLLFRLEVHLYLLSLKLIVELQILKSGNENPRGKNLGLFQKSLFLICKAASEMKWKWR